MRSSDVITAIKKTTKKWGKKRKAEERSKSVARKQAVREKREKRETQVAVAMEVIPAAYAKASNNGQYPATARQVYYAARPAIQDRSGKSLNSEYFTQTLLLKFVRENPETVRHWRLAYDARGHLVEPHTGRVVPLGTLEVEEYLSDRQFLDRGVDCKQFGLAYPTVGPDLRYGAILFCEKEGFSPLFDQVQLAERYDISIKSTKGMSVVAARRLVDELCAVNEGVPVLILHDFDERGFKISETLTSVSQSAIDNDRVRYEFQNEINGIDLGLRLTDVMEWNLESETVSCDVEFNGDTITSPEEQAFLLSGRRVELNAFTSADLITWLEGKLDEHGITKVVPDDTTLAEAYRRAHRLARANREMERILSDPGDDITVPEGLRDQIFRMVDEDPTQPWDGVLANIAVSAVDRERKSP